MRQGSALAIATGLMALAGCAKHEATSTSAASSGGTSSSANTAAVMACLPVARCGAWDGYGRGTCAALHTDGTLSLADGIHASAAPEPARACPGEAESAPGLQACMDYVETQRECANRPRIGIPPFQCVRAHGGCEAR